MSKISAAHANSSRRVTISRVISLTQTAQNDPKSDKDGSLLTGVGVPALRNHIPNIAIDVHTLDIPEVELLEGDPLPPGMQTPKPSLEDYCKPKDETQGLAMTGYVQGNWKGYGVWYWAHVTRVNHDGTFNLKYYDGIDEFRVLRVNIRRPKMATGPEIDASSTDPACQVSSVIEEMQTRIDKVQRDVGHYLVGDHAVRHVGMHGPNSYSSGSAPAPAPAFDPWSVDHSILALFGQYDSEAEALAGIDKNGDGFVTYDFGEVPSELTQALLDIGMPEEKAEENARLIGAELDPSGTGKFPVDKLKDKFLQIVADSTHLDPSSLEVGGTKLPRLIYEISQKLDEIENQAEVEEHNAALQKKLLENVDALEEMLKSARAGFTEGSGILDKMRENLAALDTGDAAQSEEVTEALEGEENAPQFLHLLGEESKKMHDLVLELEKRTKKLEEQGMLDPEMAEEVARVANSGDHMSEELFGIVNRERAVFGAAANGTSEKGLRQLETALHDDLEVLDVNVREIRTDVDHFDETVVPSPEKWWRYRWEYSFVESCMLSFLCLLAVVFEGVHELFRWWVKAEVKESALYFKDHHDKALVLAWSRFALGELAVLLMVLSTMWIFTRMGVFHVWVSYQYSLLSDVNLPMDAIAYARISLEIFMQLGVTLMLFFACMLMVLKSAVKVEVESKLLEESEQGTEQVVQSWALRWFVTNPKSYERLKNNFVSCLVASPELKQEHTKILQNDQRFFLWHFISLKVQEGIKEIYMIRWTSWVWLFVTSVIFCILTWKLEVTFVGISIFLMGVLMAVFGIMAWVAWYHAHQTTDVIMMPSEQDDKDKSTAQWLEAATSAAKLGLPRRARTVLSIVFQISLFWFCYCAARALFSPWMWRLYPKEMFVIMIMVIAIFIAFNIMLAPFMVTYFVAMSLPPHLYDEDVKFMAQVGRMAERDALQCHADNIKRRLESSGSTRRTTVI